MKIIRILSALSLLLLLFACSKSAVKPAANEEFNAELSFEKANKLIESKDYEQARALLLEIKNRDLTKKYAPLAQLRIADAYAKDSEPELAVAEYRRFLEIYPDHQHAAYAQYQVAMVYFGQIEGPERGYGGAAKALAEFEKLKKDFPRNPYKDLIDIRIEKCRTIMADYEYLVGDYYLNKKSYSAAIDRFETLMKKFPDYKKEDTVLLKLGMAYRGAGQKEKAESLLNRLIEKYPNSPLSKEAKKELGSLTKDEKKK
ncbi:MAG: outer membrane protein assembly factor BamD [Nitrospirae bacterium]|nr:outer membrane protein assembly factor BamD [Nitrospirota bacterium]